MLFFEIFISAANLLVDTRFDLGAALFAFKILAFVRAMREQPGGEDKSIDPILLIIFIHNLIVCNETTPTKSREGFLLDGHRFRI